MSQKIRLLGEGEAHTCIHSDRRWDGVTGCGGVAEDIKLSLLSAAGQIISKRRSALSSDTADKLVFISQQEHENFLD